MRSRAEQAYHALPQLDTESEPRRPTHETRRRFILGGGGNNGGNKTRPTRKGGVFLNFNPRMKRELCEMPLLRDAQTRPAMVVVRLRFLAALDQLYGADPLNQEVVYQAPIRVGSGPDPSLRLPSEGLVHGLASQLGYSINN